MRTRLLLILAAALGAADVETAKLATEDAVPLDPGTWQLALGADGSAASAAFDEAGRRYDRGGRFQERDLRLGAAYGLRADLEVGMEVGYGWAADASGGPRHGADPTDPLLMAKWRFVDRGDGALGLSLALVPELSLPAGEGPREGEIPIGSRLWGPGLGVVASLTCRSWSFGASVGRDWLQGTTRGDQRGTWHGDLACGWQVLDWLQPEVEIHHLREQTAHGAAAADATSLTAGVQCMVGETRFGLGVDQVVAGHATDRTTSLLLQVVHAF